MSKFILWFKELTIKDVPLVGGKNASLGEMYQKLGKEGIRIPNGFATTSDAYWYFIEKSKVAPKKTLKEFIKETLKNLDVKNIRNLKERGKKIRQAILKAELPEDFKEVITSAYEKLSGEYKVKNVDVAVRSSATAEDLPSISENEHVLVKVDGKPYYCKVKELYNKFAIMPNVIEIPAMEDGQIKWHKVGEIYKHPARHSKLYKIITRLKKEIVVSPNHSLIVLDEEKMVPKVSSINQLKGKELLPTIGSLPEINSGVSEIDVLDYVEGRDIAVENGLVMIKNHSNNWKIQNGLKKIIPLDKNFLYFLGLYAAEGSTYGNNFVMITNSDKEVMNKVKQFLKSINLYKGQKINKNTLRVYCKSLVRFLQSLTGMPKNIKGKGRSCGIKKVPDFVFGLPKELIGAFLRGCYDGDGYVGKKWKIINYSSTSEMLAGGIIKLLEILGFQFRLRRRKSQQTKWRDSLCINIPYLEAKKFKELIGFYNQNKLKNLNYLVELYESKDIHQDFINYLEIPQNLSLKFREKLTANLPREDKQIYFCLFCKERITKSSKYKNKNRYYCPICHKAFYEKEVIKKTVRDYVYYDEKGKFRDGVIPWNRGLFRGRHSFKEFRDYIKKNNLEEYLKFFNSNIKWDRIEKIEPVNYEGDVYDFVVPGVENFAAGLGGIITHNTASFAGQQESYLGIKGDRQLLQAVRDCVSSLFTDRAISYREDQGFDHLKIALSVGVQKMVRSDKACAGVMFSCDTESGFADVTVINSSWGLGESVVKGRVTPDEFMVYEPLIDKYKPVVSKKLGAKEKKLIYGKEVGQATLEINVPKKEREKFTLTDQEILELAKYSVIIEKHYKRPMDMEWAKDGIDKKLYIVQARPETVQSRKRIDVLEEYILIGRKKGVLARQKKGVREFKILVQGVAIGSKIGQGEANVIKNVKDIDKFKHGQVLVTQETDPDWEPVMKIASAIVTDRGGRTCHSAIVSRELGIPCIVGTGDGTRKIKTGQKVTISCAEGETGFVYKGLTPFKVERTKVESLKRPRTKIMMNLGEPEQAFSFSFIPNDGVGLAREEFIINNYIKIHPLALLNYQKIKDKKIRKQIDQITLGYQNKTQFYIDKLAEGVGRIAAAFYPKEVIVRFSDFKTNEYANLIGGKLFEPEEANPMIGWRGASRYYDPNFKEAFKLECQAIKKVREIFGLKNVVVMVPFCRTPEEAKAVLKILEEMGLKRGGNALKVYVMCEIPSNVILGDEFAKLFDGFSIGSNDLTQLTLGLDRDSSLIARLFDENNQAVKRLISQIIKIAHKYHRKVGICGQAPSDIKGFAEFLVKEGIDSISLNPDTVLKTTLNILKEENKRS